MESSIRPSISKWLLRSLAVAALFAPAQMLLLAQTAQQPNMGDIYDVLQGRTVLLPQSDIGLFKTNVTSLTSGNGYLSQLEFHSTTNSSIQSAANGAVAANNNGLFPSYGSTSNIASVAVGRMFNNGNDVVVTLSPQGQFDDLYLCGSTPKWIYNYYNPQTLSQRTYCLNEIGVDPNAPNIQTKAVMGSFRRNNLVQALMFVEADYGNYQNWQMNIVAAQDPNQVDLIASNGGSSPFLRTTTSPNASPLPSTIVTGDLNGDGVDEIAMLLSDYKTIRVFQVDPQTLAISALTTLTLPEPVFNGTLAIGHFTDDGAAHLVVAGHGDSTSQTRVAYYFTNLTKSPKITDYTVPGQDSGSYHNTIAQAADVVTWNGIEAQQLVLAQGYEFGSNNNVEVGSFSSDGVFHLQSSNRYAGCLFGMAVGNFNHISQSSTGFANNLNPNLQIATYTSDGSGDSCKPTFTGYLHINILNIGVPAGTSPVVQPNQQINSTSWLSTASSVVPNVGGYNGLQDIALLAGDFQGRSLRLGAPERTRMINHQQPRLVLEQPPMFVDYVKPRSSGDCVPGTYNSTTQLCVLNVSVFPYADNAYSIQPFASTYTSSSSVALTTTDTSTLSFSLGVKASGSSTEAWGQVGVAEASYTLKLSAADLLKGISEKYQKYFSQVSNSLAISTRRDDEIIYTGNNLTVYHYPVLGQFDSSGNQIYLTFSVPSQITDAHLSARSLDWYQPIHERFNPLSYPANFAEVSQPYANASVNKLADSSCSTVHSGDSTQTATWLQGNTTSQKTGWSNQVSVDASASFTAKVTPGIETDGAGGGVNFNVDVSGSNLYQSFNQQVTVANSAESVSVHISSVPNSSTAYDYGFQQRVFALASNIKTLQDPSNLLPSDLALKSDGPLYTNFIATPSELCGQSSGSWWRETYITQDVGLNHPDRWDVTEADLTTFNPVRLADAPPNTRVISLRGLHMKGFFISTTGSGSSPSTSTVGEVPADTKLMLSARIYNFSLVSTNQKDPQTEVHVRFYAQPMCQYDLCPGKAILVPSTGRDGDAVIASIPGQAPDETVSNPQPNWTIVSVPLDAATLYKTNQNQWSFWVVTWVEDKTTHQIMQDMPDHGINLTSNAYGNSFAGKAFSSPTDVPLEAHSNNLGIYGTSSAALVIDPPANGTPVSLPQTAALTSVDRVVSAVKPSKEMGDLQSATLTLEGTKTLFDVDNTLVVRYSAKAQKGFPGGFVTFYDGDPAQNGTLLQAQSVPSLEAGTGSSIRTYFRPMTCGVHTLYAVTSSEGLKNNVSMVKTKVGIDPSPSYNLAIAQVEELALGKSLQSAMVQDLNKALTKSLNGNDNAAFADLEHFKSFIARVPQAQRETLIEILQSVLQSANQVRDCHALDQAE